jgi:hypothetical protein
MKFNQSPRELLMIRPASFGFNSETASSNAFQSASAVLSSEISAKAIAEFERMAELLESHDIDVYIYNDTGDVVTPDAIFPNNWISFHPDGKVILYPMMAHNRRHERRLDVIDDLKKTFEVSAVIDLTSFENEGEFLEGTGSLVFDHVNKIAFACRSPRTSEKLVKLLCEKLSYRPVMFDAVDAKDQAIYHTNVMMSIGKQFAVVCLDAVKNESDQEAILGTLADSDHKVIAISFEQMNSFAGNLLEVRDRNGDEVIIISEAAVEKLLPGQVNFLTKYADLLPVNVRTIEKNGGGSVRCMMAGIHLSKRVLRA